MSGDLPDPPVPASADLRHFATMPLDVQRLRDSELACIPDAEVRWANLMSWCASWHQVPAGSLPDDDVALCRLLGYGRDLRKWRSLRSKGALRGWVRASDNRLYHPVVTEMSLGCIAKSKRQASASRARWNGQPAEKQQDRQSHGNASVQTLAIPKKGREGNREEGKGSTPPTPPDRGESATAIAKGFEEFWKLYPKRVGKRAARKAWDAAVKRAAEGSYEILTLLRVHVDIGRFDMREGGRFVPHPATWLNQDRWHDGEDPDDAPPPDQPSLLPAE